MAWKRVENYALGYQITKRSFLYYYNLEGEQSIHQFFPTPDEFIALGDMSGRSLPAPQ
jgi:hypothetical protein